MVKIHQVKYLSPETGAVEIATFTAYADGVMIRSTDTEMPKMDVEAEDDPDRVARTLASLFVYALGNGVKSYEVSTV